MFRRIHRRNPAIALKTGLMLGLGETTEELLDTLADLFGGRLPAADVGAISSAVAAADAGGAIRSAGGVRASRRVGPANGLRARGRRAVRALELSRPGNGKSGMMNDE